MYIAPAKSAGLQVQLSRTASVQMINCLADLQHKEIRIGALHGPIAELELFQSNHGE